MSREESTPTCEWDLCTREATVFGGGGSGQDDFWVCEGHDIVMKANYDSHGPYGISADEYVAEIERAKHWFRENPGGTR